MTKIWMAEAPRAVCAFCRCDESAGQNDLGRKGLFQHAAVAPSWGEVRQELRRDREGMLLTGLLHHGSLSLLSYVVQDHHSGRDPSASSINQENALMVLPKGQSDAGNSLMKSLAPRWL